MNDKKLVVVLNKGYEITQLLSGMGHVTAGLVAAMDDAREALDPLTKKLSLWR